MNISTIGSYTSYDYVFTCQVRLVMISCYTITPDNGYNSFAIHELCTKVLATFEFQNLD